jgi:hypothetical protein
MYLANGHTVRRNIDKCFSILNYPILFFVTIIDLFDSKSNKNVLKKKKDKKFLI